MVIWISMAAFIALALFRLGAAERSHLLEFGILTIFVHHALLERFNSSPNYHFQAAIGALLIVNAFSLFDEGMQFFIPHRVFDVEDLIFNGLATISVVVRVNLVRWIRGILRRERP